MALFLPIFLLSILFTSSFASSNVYLLIFYHGIQIFVLVNDSFYEIKSIFRHSNPLK